MPIIEQSTIVAPIKEFHACPNLIYANMGYSTPIQIVGLVPAYSETRIPCFPFFETCIKVFGEVSEDEYKSDFNSFLFQFPTPEGNIFILQKLVANVWTDLVNPFDATAGIFYDFMSPNYPLWSGIKIEWGKVLDNYGEGYYRLTIQNTDIYSMKFKLCAWSCSATNETVRITSYMNRLVPNYLRNNDTDFYTPQSFDLTLMSGLGWADSCRYSGFFGHSQIEKQSNPVIYASGYKRQHYETLNDKPKFEVFPIKSMDLLHRLCYYGLTGQTIYIDDYNSVNKNPMHYRKYQIKSFTYPTFEFSNSLQEVNNPVVFEVDKWVEGIVRG